MPGAENLDFGRILRLFQARSYNGFITVELYGGLHRPEEAARRSLEFLRGLKLLKGGVLKNASP